MENRGYKPRVIDGIIAKHLRAFGAVCIEGPKWCGKTWASEHTASSAIYVGDPAGSFQNRRLALADPALVLQGEAPRLIDEWQEAPALWDAVRHEVDVRGIPGQFILTGSSTPKRKGVLHSGAGRIARLRMRTMSLWESGESDGKASLRALFEGTMQPSVVGEQDLLHLLQFIVRGGWPQALSVPKESATLLAKGYVTAILDDASSRLDDVQRDGAKMLRLLKSLARNESTTVSNRVLQRDIADQEGVDISNPTILDYLDVFRRLYITEDQPPFSPAVRSSVRVKQSAKRHLTDPSIACALLGLDAKGLAGDLNTAGFLFEALCERDLHIYAQELAGSLFHYQDYRGKELDAIVELPDGRWGAFEIKLGANQIDAAAKNLLAIEKSIAEEGRGKEPTFLCVLCGLTNALYRREDGVYVVPITSLCP